MPRTRLGVSAAIAVVLGAACPALAGQPAGPQPAPLPHDTVPGRWYGGELIIAEFAGVAAVTLGAAVADLDGAAVGAVAWGVAVPAIHAVHGQPGRAMLSLGLRQGLLWSGALLGAKLGCDEPVGDHDRCELDGAATGAAIGYVAAAIIDLTFLAREPSRRRPARATTPTLAPTLAAGPGQLRLGLVGSF